MIGKLRQAIWEQLHMTPNMTSVELGKKLDQRMADVSSKLTELFRRNQVSRTKRTFINANAHQQTCWEYKAVGHKYVHVHHPLLVAAEKGTRRVVPITVTTPPQQAAHADKWLAEAVGVPLPATTDEPLPKPYVAPVIPKLPVRVGPEMTDAEKFAAYLEFKALQRAGLV
jgi:hypothetical protein